MNAERYADPTADLAVANVARETCHRTDYELPKHITEVLDIVRRVLSFAGFRIISIEIEDKKSHKRWGWRKDETGKQR